MISNIINNIFRFAALVLVQVLIINNIHLVFYINPYIYPLFILLLPIQIPNWAVLLLSFITGLTIDMFANSQGMHAAACVFIGFLRPYVIRILTPRNGYESDDQPNIKYLGYAWFITYVSIMIVLHHLLYFFIEVHSFTEIGRTLLKILLSACSSLFLILLIEIILSPQTKRRYDYN